MNVKTLLSFVAALASVLPIIASAYTVTYTYDGLNRLVKAETVGSTFQLAHTYSYDIAGNTTSIVVQSNRSHMIDTITFLKVITGSYPGNVTPGSDVNQDGRVGLEEAVNALNRQKSGL